MPSRSMFRLKIRFDPAFPCMRAVVVIFAAFSTPAWADSAAEMKAVDTAIAGVGANCEKLVDGSQLSKDSVYLKYLSNDVLNDLNTLLGVKKEYEAYTYIEQVRVRMSDGRQFFLVLHDSASYRCKAPAQLPVKMVHPVEPLTDVRLEINPCCTYTYGGDAMAQWFNLVNCPLSKPKKVASSICGH